MKKLYMKRILLSVALVFGLGATSLSAEMACASKNCATPMKKSCNTAKGSCCDSKAKLCNDEKRANGTCCDSSKKQVKTTKCCDGKTS